MINLIRILKEDVIRLASNKQFVHHSWYVKYHLNIVEKLAMELCDVYRSADRHIVTALVWLHDFGKIINSSREETTIELQLKLLRLGFPQLFIDSVILYLSMIDRKTNMEKTPIEVQIVSSADGASHLTGPFQFLWWYENSDKPFEELMNDNVTKLNKDWKKKIVIPEVREAFKNRREYMLELSGHLPQKFISHDLK